jgi:carboxyl-terminal processing protease
VPPKPISRIALSLPLAAALVASAAVRGDAQHAAARHVAGRSSSARTAAAGAPVSPERALASFDTAWAVIGRTLWDTAFIRREWPGVRDELRPRAAAANTYPQIRGVLDEMISRLHLSHFEVIPGDVQARLGSPAARTGGDAGLEVRLVGDRFLVTRVDSGGPADRAGVRTGWTVDAVNGRTAAEMLRVLQDVPAAREPRGRQLYAWITLTHALQGAPGDVVRARFVDGDGRTVEKALALRPSPVQSEKFGNLPALNVSSALRRIRLPDGTDVGVIRFNYWMPVVIRSLDAYVDSLRGADGIVIDLRGNLGGVGAMAPGFAGHFIDRVDTLGVMHLRAGTLYLVTNPRRVDTQARPVRPYAGPVAVLTDAMSASTSEFFAGGMQALGRARVFGEQTAGQALPALATVLPDGDVLMHAIADFTGPRGQRFEGAGVTPDVPAPPTRAALLAGHDPALDAALAWIAQEKTRRAPAR